MVYTMYNELKFIRQTTQALMTSWVLFYEVNMIVFEKIPIYCPRCNRQVLTYDGNARSSLSAKCNRCNKLVTYYPMKDETKISNLPERATGSGSRYY